MKKSTKVIIGILLTVTIALVTFRAIDHEPVNTLPLDKKVAAISQNSGCNLCHTKDHKLPWYSGLPILNTKLKRDMKKGIEAIDLSDLYKFGDTINSMVESVNFQKESINSQKESINSQREIILNKLYRIDKVMEDHSMPPISFTIL